MILTDQEVEDRLNSPENLVNVIHKKNNTKQAGDTSIPNSVKQLIAITAGSSDDTQKEIATTFGVSQGEVSYLSRGLVGGNKLDKNLQSVVKTAKEEKQEKIEEQESSAHQAALDVLMTSLTALQPKLVDPEIKPKDLSRIASDMAKVARDMRGDKSDKDKGSSTNVQVILMAPERKKLSSYEILEA